MLKRLTLLLACALSACCGERHLLRDQTVRNQIHADFTARRAIASGRDAALFDVLQTAEMAEREALEFLYAYMPICDLADYDGAYFLNQARGALRARKSTSWSRSVPDDLFLHFVLPPRVSNETLDEARDVIFAELSERVESMTMSEAALEVNHWCHEKMNYRGTDARTCSPLASMLTSWGRCGEESVLCVAALRAVGIPARQCYVPRWAHTDSNHAWVEVWVDGRWHYMGACEPEPVLDRAWFDVPASRAMMTHATAYGPYANETANIRDSLYTVLNTLSVYAPTRLARACILNASGQPAIGAAVQFCVYNGAELCPIAYERADSLGRVELLTGRGDLIILADDGVSFGMAVSAPDAQQIQVVLDRTSGERRTEEFTLTPPQARPARELDPSLASKNELRLREEDSIRMAYMRTFPTPVHADSLASLTRIDTAHVRRWIKTSQGNWREIESLLRTHAATPTLAAMLGTLREKDFRDTPAAALADHLACASDDPDVIGPRIEFEKITPWRSYFRERFSAKMTPEQIIRHVAHYIRVEPTWVNTRISPQGVHELGVADRVSRNIYFVAICRSLGHPARLNPATARPEYRTQDRWIDADFEQASGVARSQAPLRVFSSPENPITPQYGVHFTLARFDRGLFRTLNLERDFTGSDSAGADGAMEAPRPFPVTLSLDRGYYRLLVASRRSDGSAVIRTTYFPLDKADRIEIELPQTGDRTLVRGTLDMNYTVGPTSLKQLSESKGLILCFIDGKEPSRHLVQEFSGAKTAIETWGGGFYFIGDHPNALKGAQDGALLEQVKDALKLREVELPLTIYVSDNGGILFERQGYAISTFDQLLRLSKHE